MLLYKKTKEYALIYLLFYYLFFNLLAVLITIYDKFAAKNGLYRISEKTLWTISFLGGALLMYSTMRLIRHKTLHKKIMILLPVLIVLHVIIFCMLTVYIDKLFFI